MEGEQLDSGWLPVLQCLVDTVLTTPLDGKKLKLNQKAYLRALLKWSFYFQLRCLRLQL